jgi:anti-anti-sigma factor
MAQTTIKSSQHEGQPCIEIRGQWEQNTLDSLIRTFQKSMAKVESVLFLRLTDLDYLDSAALGVIMFHMNELAKRSARLILIDPSPEMRQILRTTSLDKVLEIR